MQKKILATGLTGLVGSRIVELLSDDYQFLDLNLPRFNILDFKSLAEVFKKETQARIFLHLAAFTDVAAAWKERGDKSGLCYQVNVLGTRNIARLCQSFGKYLIFVSTDFVFDGQKDSPYTEEDQACPLDWYGQTKFLAEKEVQKRLTDYAIIRIAFPYRAIFEPKIDLVRRIIQDLKEKKLYPMFADQITTPTFIDDIAAGLRKFFELKPKGIFHLVASSFQSPYDLAIQIAQVFKLDQGLVKKSSLVEFEKNQPANSRPWPRFLGLANTKVKNQLGIEMTTLKAGLEKMKSQLESLVS